MSLPAVYEALRRSGETDMARIIREDHRDAAEFDPATIRTMAQQRLIERAEDAQADANEDPAPTGRWVKMPSGVRKWVSAR
ncbi:hypothetical protein [Kineosporia sp. NBRC 101731]|uniref:hypothetical protein n=1 Tax=Kineosporia sp. NBRC 101731 TaxID=3032199 RepID=UPI00255491AC|nr:hypothetical protein [Kineosporia sp. NBRC 101731]